MKKSDIEQLITIYDVNKGYGRWLKDEPHIANLKEFILYLDETYLTAQGDLLPKALFNLADVLLTKKNRSDSQESAKLFNKLAEKLGGYSALECLTENKSLYNEKNITLFMKFPHHSQKISSSLVNLSDELPSDSFHLAQEIAYKISSITHLLSFLKKAKKTASTHYSLTYYQLMFNLIKYNNSINIANILDIPTEEITHLAAIINYLINKKSFTLTATTIDAILAVPKLSYLKELLLLLPVDQDILTCLLQTSHMLETCESAKKIIISFNDAKWTIKPYLQAVLNSGSDSNQLSKAISALIGLALPEASRDAALTVMVTYSSVSYTGCLEAIKILKNRDLLNLFNLQAIDAFKINSPDFVRILYLLDNAKLFSLLNQFNLNLLHNNAVYITQLLFAFHILSMHQLLNQSNINFLLQELHKATLFATEDLDYNSTLDDTSNTVFTDDSADNSNDNKTPSFYCRNNSFFTHGAVFNHNELSNVAEHNQYRSNPLS